MAVCELCSPVVDALSGVVLLTQEGSVSIGFHVPILLLNRGVWQQHILGFIAGRGFDDSVRSRLPRLSRSCDPAALHQLFEGYVDRVNGAPPSLGDGPSGGEISRLVAQGDDRIVVLPLSTG